MKITFVLATVGALCATGAYAKDNEVMNCGVWAGRNLGHCGDGELIGLQECTRWSSDTGKCTPGRCCAQPKPRPQPQPHHPQPKPQPKPHVSAGQPYQHRPGHAGSSEYQKGWVEAYRDALKVCREDAEGGRRRRHTGARLQRRSGGDWQRGFDDAWDSTYDDCMKH